jgi:hypothetical protein
VIAAQGARLGVELAKASRAGARFATEQGGEYFAAGVRGPITGRRADLVIIDDPVKSWAEAESQAARDGLYDWYRAELAARLKPEGRVVLIMTGPGGRALVAPLPTGTAPAGLFAGPYPNAISGLSGWWDAGSPSGFLDATGLPLAASNAVVGAVADKSGNGTVLLPYHISADASPAASLAVPWVNGFLGAVGAPDASIVTYGPSLDADWGSPIPVLNAGRVLPGRGIWSGRGRIGGRERIMSIMRRSRCCIRWPAVAPRSSRRIVPRAVT